MTTNDYKKNGVLFRKREKVAEFSHCGLNPMYRHYLSFDLDDRCSVYRFEDCNLPTPTIITTNRWNGKCHYLYRIKTAVAYHENSRSAPQDFFEAIQEEMRIRLRADKAYNHTLTKNPLNDRWRVQTFPVSYDLSDFLEYITLPKRGTIKALPDNLLINGRNDKLFHTLRIWAYGVVHKFADCDSWSIEVFSEALDINSQFENPLPVQEVKHTAKSVSSGVWKYRRRLGNSGAKVLNFTNENAMQRMTPGVRLPVTCLL
ncbi:hypothetical protein AAKU67_004509 [Oxalobacteraceae bacterium GrIS 2.11]